MPSKGVQCYSYVAAPGYQVIFSVPGTTIIRDQLRVASSDHLEVDKAKLNGLFNFTGTFSIKVVWNGAQIAYESVDINTLTGNLEAGSLKTMENQTSVIANNNVIICYGFYDAGPGVAGLPSSNQCYVTVTPSYSNWMSEVAPPNSPQASKPFTRLFLPAAHDIGMNSMQNSDTVLSSSSAFVGILSQLIPTFAKVAGMVSHDAVLHIAPNIIRGLAITQKDTLTMILNLGARYFEFRPAFLHSAIRNDHPLPDQLYFSHSAIPGMAYAQFLHDTVAFLTSHSGEIVVVQLRWDGVPAECARPSDADLASYLNNAIAGSNGSLVAGSLADMQTQTIAELRSQRKRLIVFGPTDSYSTYTDTANATLDGASIVTEFKKLSSDTHLADGKSFINLQCQATATNIPDAVAYSVVAANADSSILLATKPICDAKTLSWIEGNAGVFNGVGELVVCMNDFFDGRTADVAVDWSRKRLQ